MSDRTHGEREILKRNKVFMIVVINLKQMKYYIFSIFSLWH